MGKNRFRNTFVHRNCTGENCAANIRKIKQFEQALNRAVFAEWAMKKRHDDSGTIR